MKDFLFQVLSISIEISRFVGLSRGPGSIVLVGARYRFRTVQLLQETRAPEVNRFLFLIDPNSFLLLLVRHLLLVTMHLLLVAYCS